MQGMLIFGLMAIASAAAFHAVMQPQRSICGRCEDPSVCEDCQTDMIW
jgi:hypothetical protein